MSYKDQIQLFILVLSLFNWATFSFGRFHPVDNYLIDCGSPTNTSIGDRSFISDSINSKILTSTSQDVLASTTSTPIISFGDDIYLPLYQTARIFIKTSKYTFPIHQHGRHWIRLYFSPFVYNTYDMSTATFSVSTENYVLLSDFSTYNTTYVKEFSVNVTSESLVLIFTASVNSFAFVNAIEVVSVPDELITDDAQTFGTFGNFHELTTQALETIARVNMGGPMLSSENDTLWRTWLSDQVFIVHKNFYRNVTSNMEDVKYNSLNRVTPDIAPTEVYSTAIAMDAENTTIDFNFNITWEFNVDQGFLYLFRFHFCDIVSPRLNLLYFNVYIDSWNVAPDLDLSSLSFYSLSSALYIDYVTMSTVSNKLRVSIGPSINDLYNNGYRDAILNGLEIMKINNSMGSLSATVSPLGKSLNHSSSKKKHIVLLLIIGMSVGALIVVALVVVTMWKNKRRLPLFVNRSKLHSTGSKHFNESPPSTNIVALDIGRNHIPFVTIQEATNNFDESWVIGNGGFGKVYKGVLHDGTKVAIKRKNSLSQQGLTEFKTEIKMLSLFRHRHLVSLIGYCDEQSEMILVYEYVENGTLRSHLYGSGLPILSWKQRLEICIGAARGLHYLHTGFPKVIIHRDVKTANILLDENLKAKVADFGLTKIGPDISQADYVSTKVKGSFGYLDPEYFRRQRLTVKSDVYSFGVVLFEVLCGRAVVDSSLPTEKIGLAGWAMKWQKAGELEQIIDPSLVGNIRLDSFKKFGEIAEKCLAEVGINRPSMGEVLQNLECALRLQEADLEGDLKNLIGSSEVIGDLCQ